MNVEKVMRRFSQIAGKPLDDVTQWWQLCEESISELRSQLKSGVDEVANEDRLNSAAAAYSFYRYILHITSRESKLDIGEGIGIATVTDRKNMLYAAEASWKNALASISDIISDDKFIFIGIK